MGQKIKNDLQNVTIGGSYTGGNSNNYYSSHRSLMKIGRAISLYFCLITGMTRKRQTGLVSICQSFLA